MTRVVKLFLSGQRSYACARKSLGTRINKASVTSGVYITALVSLGPIQRSTVWSMSETELRRVRGIQKWITVNSKKNDIANIVFAVFYSQDTVGDGSISTRPTLRRNWHRLRWKDLRGRVRAWSITSSTTSTENKLNMQRHTQWTVETTVMYL